MVEPLATPSHIAFAGDWHMNTPWAVQMVRVAADQGARVVIHLGDFGYTFDPRFLGPLESELARADLPLLFVDGNHEDHDRLEAWAVRDDGLRQLTEHIWHLPRGFRWRWEAVDFLALGGAVSVDRPWRVSGRSWWPQEEITTEQAASAIAGGTADVLISHDCPAGVVIPGLVRPGEPSPWPPEELLRSGAHRRLLRSVVDAVQPRWIFHGHYHLDYQLQTDLGYGPLAVQGLGRDDTAVHQNLAVVELRALSQPPAPPGP